MADPFLITEPTLISLSGGRTSAMLVRRHLDAHGGRLPDHAVVAFANTGKEREETLRFVHEIASRWGVRVRWVEYRDRRAAVPLTERFEEVGYNSASRNGEPFDLAITHRSALPNTAQRWCTEELKVKTLQRLMEALGFGAPGTYVEAIGLRADELHRVRPGLVQAEKAGRRVVHPLAIAGLSKADVRQMWWGNRSARFETRSDPLPQGFDLELDDLWGNCDFCFAMGVAIRRERARVRPKVTGWWRVHEQDTGATFSKRETVEEIEREAIAHAATPDMFAKLLAGDMGDAECGTWCPTESA